MRCGQEVQIIDAWGSIAAIAVSQCGGGFRVIVHSTDWRDKHDAPFRNGEILSDWRMLLDRLVWLIGHAPDEPGYAYIARTAGARYVQVTLYNSPATPALVTELAMLLEIDPAQVRGRLANYLVIPVPVGESEGDHPERQRTPANDAEHSRAPANAGEQPDTGAALG